MFNQDGSLGGADSLSTSGFSELKDAMEKECEDLIFFIIFGKIISNKHMGDQNDISQLEVLLISFHFFPSFSLLNEVNLLSRIKSSSLHKYSSLTGFYVTDSHYPSLSCASGKRQIAICV